MCPGPCSREAAGTSPDRGPRELPDNVRDLFLKELKEEQKRKKELQLARNKKKMEAKKDKEQDKDKTGSNKEVDGVEQQQPGARSNNSL